MALAGHVHPVPFEMSVPGCRAAPRGTYLFVHVIRQVRREPKEVQQARRAEAAAANAAANAAQREKNEAKKPAKGKNRPSRRQKKKQLNVIEDARPGVRERMREQGVSTAEHGGRFAAVAAQQQSGVPDGVPRALQRFYKKGA